MGSLLAPMAILTGYPWLAASAAAVSAVAPCGHRRCSQSPSHAAGSARPTMTPPMVRIHSQPHALGSLLILA